jgi:hypothetical protein
MSQYSESAIKDFISIFITKDKENQTDVDFLLNFVSFHPSNFKVLIKHLDIFITSNNDLLRKNSIKIFAIILEKIPNLVLENHEEYKNLLKFAYSKMKDVVCAPLSVKIIYCNLF